MKTLITLTLTLTSLFAFSQNGATSCDGQNGQLNYYEGFYQRTEHISSTTSNARMGDPAYKSAFYNLAVPFSATAGTRTFSADACGAFNGSLYLGSSASCTTGITQLDANGSCSSSTGVSVTNTGSLTSGSKYIIEINTKNSTSGTTEDGATNLIWSWKYTGPEACDTPSISEVTMDHSTNSASVAFTNGDGSTPSGTYEVYLLSEHDETDTVDLPVLGNPTMTVTSSPFTLTNLTPNTNYRIWMSQDCGNGLGSGFTTDEATYIDTTDQGATAGGTVCDAIALSVGVKANPYDQNMHLFANTETGEPQASCHSGAAYQSMWFTFIAPPSGNVRISTDTETQGAVTDTEIALYAQPSSCSDLTTFGSALACDTNSGVSGDGNLSVIEHTGLTAGDTYYIQVNAFNTGSYGIEVLELLGDASSEAVTINVDDVAVNFDMTSATLSSATNGCSITALKDAWVKFVAPSAGNVLLELITSNSAPGYLELFEYVNGAYTALGVCGSGSLDINVAQQTSSTSGFRPLAASTELTAGNTYFLRIVQEDGNSFTSFSLKASNPNTLGAHEFENNGILIYPNPTQNQLFIRAAVQADEVHIFDITGKTLKIIKPTGSAISVDMLSAGVYILAVSIGEETHNFKFVKD